MKMFPVAFILTAVLCKFLKVPNEIKSISIKQTQIHWFQAKVESTGEGMRGFSDKLWSEA